MNEREASERMAEWIGETLDIPDEARYPFYVATKTGPLTSTQPDVAAVVERKRTLLADRAAEIFPYVTLQQHSLVRVFETTASVMIAVANTEAGAMEATQKLQGFGATLEAAALEDPSLGDRFELLSPEIVVDYSPVFDEDDAGLRGRVFNLEIVVGELVDGDFEGLG